MNKKISFPIAIIIIAVLAVLVGGIVVWQYLKIPVETDLSEIGMPPDQTADWKTYSSDYFGFEIKYPSDWFLNANIQNVSTVKPGEWLPLETLPTGHAKIMFEKTGIQSIDELINERFGVAPNNMIVSDSVVVLNDLEGREVVYTCKNCEEKYIPEIDLSLPGIEGRAIFFSRGNNVIYFWLTYYRDDPKADYYVNIFNQILSTFRFLE